MSELISDLPTALKNHASWLVNAGAEDTRRNLSQMEGSPDDIRILKAAIATEKSREARSSRLKPMEAKLRKFQSVGPQKTPLENLADKTDAARKSEALTTAKPSALTAVLATSADAISLHHSRLDEINRKSQDEALLPGLCIGLHCLRAHCAFVVTKDQRKGVGGRGKKTPSTVEGVSPGGFEGWLAKLNEERSLRISTGSAYRAMTALKGLGLDHDATEKQVAKALQQLRRKGPVTLKSLCDAAVEAVGPPPEPPAKIEQTEFDFLRDGLSAFRTQADALLALKADLHKHPDMERVASARIYSLLVEITGSHWKPSDEPDDLANVNPDAIEL